MNKIMYSFLIAMALCLSARVYAGDTSENLYDNILRLHIVANSDSAEDQAVKLKVRDTVLDSVRESGSVPKEREFEETANRVLKENGFEYSAKAEMGEFYFPRKEYKDIVMPAGKYRGLRVVLGEGNGQNWWCIMYPPLCFAESTEGELTESGASELRAILDDETYELITSKPEIKFKIVEMINAVLK